MKCDKCNEELDLYIIRAKNILETGELGAIEITEKLQTTE